MATRDATDARAAAAAANDGFASLNISADASSEQRLGQLGL